MSGDLTIICQPVDRIVQTGQSATLEVEVLGTSPISYQWSADGVAIPGATSSTYTTPILEQNSAPVSYQCVITNVSCSGAGLVSSDVVTVMVATCAPVFTSQPKDVSVLAGCVAKFRAELMKTCVPVTYQWYVNGVPIPGATRRNLEYPTNAATPATSTVYVVASNSCGTTTSRTATLTIGGGSIGILPVITEQPKSITVNPGATVKFAVMADNATNYQWAVNGMPIVGATSPTYITENVSNSMNNSSYTVAVSNGAGTVTSEPAILRVVGDPIITTQPISTTIQIGQAATFTIAATGTNPITYQWYRNNAAVPGAINPTYITPVQTTAVIESPIYCVVTNPVNSVTSNTVFLTVGSIGGAPIITAPPASARVSLGQPVTFSVQATGAQPFTYEWRRNGAILVGQTASTYTIPVTTAADNNSLFTVTVSNNFGTTTSAIATLTVTSTPDPFFVNQPASVKVRAGKSATFTVAVGGSGPFVYQWRVNNMNIPGANLPTYTISKTNRSMDGQVFTCVVTGMAGTTVSNPATLTVTPNLTWLWIVLGIIGAILLVLIIIGIIYLLVPSTSKKLVEVSDRDEVIMEEALADREHAPTRVTITRTTTE